MRERVAHAARDPLGPPPNPGFATRRDAVFAARVIGMRGAGDHLSIGERVAFYRARRGLTQAQVAAMVSRSEDWLSKIERGERDLRKLDLIVGLASALRVSVGDLLGYPVLMEDDEDPGGHDIPAVRDALMTPRRLSRLLYARTVSADVNVQHVAVFAEQAWSDFQRGRVGKVILVLPDLIAAAQALEDQSTGDPAEGWGVSARIHHLAATTLAKIGEGDLAWLAAERAMYAADQSEDALVLASATRAGTHALLSAGRYDEAMQLGSTAAQFLAGEMDADDPAAQSLLGMLYLRASSAAARHDDRTSVEELLGMAEVAAEKVGRDANFWQTSFGPTNVAMHRLADALELGDVAYVVEHGPEVEAGNMPSERAVSHSIDLARAQSMVGHDEDALQTLMSAEAEAPQLVRHSAAVRETVKTLRRRSPITSRSKSSPLLGLAERCRAV
jgi:transcriptional regulator with XRE-family HTH domain